LFGSNRNNWLPNNLGHALRSRPYRPKACAEALQLAQNHRLKALCFLTQPAVHEAGHAIVAWQSRFASAVFEITCDIEEGKTETGRINSIYMEPPGLWEWAAIDLAGLAAELLIFNRFNSFQSRDDLMASRNNSIAVIHSNVEQQWRDEPSLGSLSFERMFATDKQPTEPVVQVMNVSDRRAKALILCERDRFARLALELHKKGSMLQQEIEQLLGPRFPAEK